MGGVGLGGRVGGGGGQVRRVRVDVNEELKFLRKFTKKKRFFFFGAGVIDVWVGGVRGGGGVGSGGSGGGSGGDRVGGRSGWM